MRLARPTRSVLPSRTGSDNMRRPSPTCLRAVVVLAALAGSILSARASDRVLNSNSDLQGKAAGATAPAGFTLEGDAVYGEYPDRQSERAGRCVRLLSGRDKNGDGVHRGSVS